MDALKNQVQESEACVKSRGWILADRYVESKSGTTTRGRKEYSRLFDDLKTDKFDIIVIKSQDRLMRNVKDWYLFLDRMASQKKRLFMYMEQKFYSAKDGLITGIKAILAEEYSRELSRKINNAHRHRQLYGGRVMVTSMVFGFCKRQDGSLEVMEEEAEVIRKIYEYCGAGYGSRAIANIFLDQGYKKRTGKPLTATAVGRIIRNPLYKGTMVMNRFHYDFETKRTLKVPREQWIYGEGRVPAIVDAETWARANEKMTERAGKYCRNAIAKREDGGEEKDGPGLYALSGKLICGQCGKPYYRTRRYGSGHKKTCRIEWKCSNYLENGRTVEKNQQNKKEHEKIREDKQKSGNGCDNAHLDEEIVFKILEQAASQCYDFCQQDKNKIMDRAIEILRKVFQETPEKKEWEQLEEEEERLRQQKDFLLTKFLEQVISDQDYRKKDDDLEKRLAELRRRKDCKRQKEGEIRNPGQRIEEIRSRLEEGGIEKASVVWMLRKVREIRVHDWQLELCFDPLKVVDLPENLWKENRIVDYPFPAETEKGRYLDRRRIMSLLRADPKKTAGKLSIDMGRTISMVRNRMEELTRGGYIWFNGRGGRGEWEILKELPDKEVSMREGGL